MARPNKQGLDYFALDVKMDDETELIEAEHGHIGFVVLIKMFQKIYSNGYYIHWNDKQQLLFSKKVSVDRNEVVSIVNDCIKWDVFNGELHDKYGILTSKRIQEQYSRSVYKRVGVEMIQEYLLADISDTNNIEVIRVSDNGNSPTTDVSDSKSTQSKVKETKSNKTKENEEKYSDEFKEFWSVYPKKADKGKSYKSFKAKRKKHSLDVMIEGARKYANQIKKDGTETKFIKNGSTFLNNDSFLDEYEEQQKTTKPQKSADQLAHEKMLQEMGY